MSRTSSSTSKPSLSSFGYRVHALAGAGIAIDEIAWRQLPASLQRKVADFLDFSSTVPPSCDLAKDYSNRSQAFRVALHDEDLLQANLAQAEKISNMARQVLSKPEARWTNVIEQGLATLLITPELDYMQDAPWNAAPHPLPAAESLPQPKPDFAIGFSEVEPARGDVRTAPVWSKAFIGGLKVEAGLYLNAHVASSQPTLVFPFFAFEAKSALGSTYAAVNQLSGSLSYALGKLRQLRNDATKGSFDERLYLFGAVSSGRSWDIYVAYEVDPAESEMRCALVSFWSGNIMDVAAALEFIWIMERLRCWALLELKDVLTRWLELLRPS